MRKKSNAHFGSLICCGKPVIKKNSELMQEITIVYFPSIFIGFFTTLATIKVLYKAFFHEIKE